MRFVKPRKRRGIKKDGMPSMDMCSCYAFGCDPYAMSSAFNAKIHSRMKAGVCPSCGWNPCRCKSAGDIKRPILVVGDSRRLK